MCADYSNGQIRAIAKVPLTKLGQNLNKQMADLVVHINNIG